MSRYHEFRDKDHNFDCVPDPTTDFKDALSYDSLSNDEFEPVIDSAIITISAENAYRLDNDSRHKMISLYTDVNQIVKNHLDWHAFAPDAKMIYMPKSWISKVINELTEEQISRIARDVANEFKDYCLMLYCEFTISSFLDFVRTWSRINKTPIRLLHTQEGDLRLLLKHDMGSNYSLLIKEIFRSIMDGIFHLKIETFITENMVAIRILR